MILEVPSESYKPFAIYTTQSSEELTFIQFKSKLRSCEKTEKFDIKTKSDNVMKADMPSIVCYGCGNCGHVSKECRQRSAPKWCNYHRSSTHSDEPCKRKTNHKDDVKQIADGQKDQEEEQTFVFKVSQKFLPDNIKSNGLMVDCGATSHIITEEDAFAKFDETFNPNAHYIELADGTSIEQRGIEMRGRRGVFAGQRRKMQPGHTEEGLIHTVISTEHILCESSYY